MELDIEVLTSTWCVEATKAMVRTLEIMLQGLKTVPLGILSHDPSFW